MAATASLLAAGGAVSPPGYLFAAKHAMPISVGAEYDNQPLEIESGGDTEKIDVTHIYGVFGVDVAEFLTLYGRAGRAQCEIEDLHVDGDGFEWGLGLRLQLWEYDLQAPYFLKGRWGIEAGGEYSAHESDIDGTDASWNETSCTLTLSWELRDSFTYVKDWEECYSLVLAGGVAYSKIDGDIAGADFNANGRSGFVGSADIFFAKNLSVGGEVRVFDEAQVKARFGLHF